MTSRLSELNAHAEVLSKEQARAVNVAAAVGLERVLSSNLGPRGTLKLLVGGAGQLRLTKDGLVLLKEMQIQHPTASMIARTATAQDDITGDGTTTTVLLCGELMKQADRYANEGLHPRVLVDGLEIARDAVVKFLTEFSVKPTKLNQDDDTSMMEETNIHAAALYEYQAIIQNRDLLHHVASTSLHTKLDSDLAEQLTTAIVDAMQCIARMDDNHSNNTNTTVGSHHTMTMTPIDLHRVEIMSMPRKSGLDSRFVNGIVLDHGGRHPDMPKVLYHCHVMVCNVSLEYERTEVAAGFFYSNAEEREKLVESERKWLDDRCQQIVALKRQVCKENEVR
jgi:T-complex protein 1 subunit zeta